MAHEIDWDCIYGRCRKETGKTAYDQTPLIGMINTIYKPKSRKVYPVDDHPSDGSVPSGDPDLKKYKWKTAKVSDLGNSEQAHARIVLKPLYRSNCYGNLCAIYRYLTYCHRSS